MSKDRERTQPPRETRPIGVGRNVEVRIRSASKREIELLDYGRPLPLPATPGDRVLLVNLILLQLRN